MSESTSAPAPITPDHLARIKRDAQRGIGASSGDTLRLVHYLASFRAMCWKSFSEFVKVVDTAQTLTHEVERLNEEYDKAWRHDLNDKNNVQVLASEVARLTSFESAYREWIDKTKWVQESVHCSELGKHLADVMRERINQLTDVNTRLLDQVKVLQSDANSWQSGYDRGRAMGKKSGEEFRCKTCSCEWIGTKSHPDTDCKAPDVRAGWQP